MTKLIDPRRIVDRERQLRGSAFTSEAAAWALQEPVKLANIEWQTGEHGFQCAFIEQVWMPASADFDAGVCQDLSSALFDEGR